MAAIEVSGLTVRRGGKTVLRDLSLTVPRGQVTGLLGPSGSGKTTLLRTLVGTQQYQAGTVQILGLPAGSAALRARIGYTTQAASVYPDLTAEENVRYHAALHRRPRAAVADALQAVDLAEDARRPVRAMSGGQISRVSLACALVAEPELLLLDEPTVGLDPVLRRDLWDLFRAQATAGVTLVVSSHVMDEATRCDRLLLLREGRLVADDTPDGLLASTGAPGMDEAFLRLLERTMPAGEEVGS
jgi:ABC-2 type transport system ATP-binding protein